MSHHRIGSEDRDWVVHIDLGALATGSPTAVVTPAPFHEGPATSSGQPSHTRSKGLVIRGFAYTYLSGGANAGFDITSYDDQSTTTQLLWEARAASGVSVAFGLDDLLWPLRRSGDAASPSIGDVGGILRVQGAGTVTSGTLSIWGTHGGSVNYGDDHMGPVVTFTS